VNASDAAAVGILLRGGGLKAQKGADELAAPQPWLNAGAMLTGLYTFN
jgi:hypothetical protein